MDGYVHAHLNRRRFITGVGAAAAVGSMSAAGLARPAQAAVAGNRKHFASYIPRVNSPKPIPQVVPTGLPADAAPFDQIHWLLPGPAGATTQILLLEAFGLDVDPSTITDFKGYTAYAVVAGKATDGDGAGYDVEVDVRVMQGHYVGEDGRTHYGTFGFF